MKILSVKRLLFAQKLRSLKDACRASKDLMTSSCNCEIGSVRSSRSLKSGISKASQFFLGSLIDFLSCSTASCDIAFPFFRGQQNDGLARLSAGLLRYLVARSERCMNSLCQVNHYFLRVQVLEALEEWSWRRPLFRQGQLAPLEARASSI